MKRLLGILMCFSLLFCVAFSPHKTQEKHYLKATISQTQEQTQNEIKLTRYERRMIMFKTSKTKPNTVLYLPNNSPIRLQHKSYFLSKV